MTIEKKRRPGRPRAPKGTKKQSTNLSLDPDALARAQAYTVLHGTSLSRLVSEMLRALPLEEEDAPRSPVVRRLAGIAAGSGGREAYREHLVRKHGVD